MTYRNALTTDYDKIKEYCSEHEINIPNESAAIFIAEHEGEIKGIVGLKKVYSIEPLISDSSVIANNLYRMIDGVIKSNNVKRVRAIVGKENKKFLGVLDKEDFLIIEDDKLILERSEDG